MTAKQAIINTAESTGISFSDSDEILFNPPETAKETSMHIKIADSVSEIPKDESPCATEFAWVMLPIPSDAPMRKTAYVVARPFMPRPFLI